MYLREGDTMPWFPSLRLFRQAEANNWEPVIERIAGELRRLV